MKKMNKKEINLKGPVSTLIAFIILICIFSFILNKIGFQGYRTVISNGILADTLVNVKNILSVSGIRFIMGNVITNFSSFEPLALLIISLIGIGIADKSGFLNVIFKPLKRVKIGIVIYITILVSLICTSLGDYGYAFLIPFVAVMYKYLDRNPLLGIIITYLSLTLGYGTGFILNYNDYSLGILTELAATIDVDPNFTYSLTSTLYIKLISFILLSLLLYGTITRFLLPKFPIKAKVEIEELNNSKKGVALALISGFISILVVIYMIIDINLPGAGILLDHDSTTYVAKLFSDNAPFKEGIVAIISAVMMIMGFVYGKFSGNIKNSSEYSLGLSKNFENLGMLFVLLFFTAELLAILDWTNIGIVIASNLITFVSKLQFSGILLIITMFIIIVLMSILIPSTITKWEISSPVIVPLFMRANIAPNFTQFIFQIADAVGKAFSPIFVYFIIMLSFLQKYNIDEKKQISIFGVFKLMMPTIIIVSICWIIFISLWFLTGFPIGPNTYIAL
jgi:aminobenzoyl-glutamate transport protein